jgi:hypothetical protein
LTPRLQVLLKRDQEIPKWFSNSSPTFGPETVAMCQEKIRALRLPRKNEAVLFKDLIGGSTGR